MSAVWEPVGFEEIAVVDDVATLLGTSSVVGRVAAIVDCKDHVRAVDETGAPLARSDYPRAYRLRPADPAEAATA